MALKKAVENDSGISFEYWRVLPSIVVDFAEGRAQAHLQVWVTEAARRANKRPAHIHEAVDPAVLQPVEEALVLSGDDFASALTTGDLRAAFYGKLKTLDFFEGAEDVLEED